MKLVNKTSKKWVFITGVSMGLIGLVVLIAMNPFKPAISEPTVVQSQNQRIFMLEYALAPQTAQEAALIWAKGVKTRNGALQFAVLAPKLRSEKEAEYINLNWVTGFSSPWVESYKISRQEQMNESWEFEIEYQMMTSTGSAGTRSDRIHINHLPIAKNHPQGWYITKINSFYN